MRYLVYLMTLLFVGTAIAQNPTIVQGNYITNVFGNSNFVLNPNALTNVANVTNATRSTTTPLVATSEFTLSLASGANATWTLRAFDGGMKGQNCEARFTYRGFATATTKAEIVQNSLVVASLTLTPTTDPRIASINFPCGDLANLTTFRIAQTTANMTGTNEIGGIYVGLATNMANVAQAEMVVSAKKDSAQSFSTASPATVIYNSKSLDVYGEFNTSTGEFTAKRAGTYQFNVSLLMAAESYSAANSVEMYLQKNGTTFYIDRRQADATVNTYRQVNAISSVTLAVGDTVRAQIYQDSGGTRNAFVGSTNQNQFIVHRFPSSSELVVTPERQNVFASVKWSGGSDFIKTSATSDQVVNTTNFGTVTTFGKANVASTTCSLATNDIGMCLQNVPPGIYEITSNLEFGSRYGDGTPGSAVCSAHLDVAGTSLSSTRTASALATAQASGTEDWTMLGSGIVKIDSLQTNLSVVLKVSKDSAPGGCRVRSQTSSGANAALPTITFKPLDQPSNSALYVEGPVKAAATGAAIPAGYVGEEIRNTSAITTAVTTTADIEINVPNGSITLTPGVWELQYNVAIGIERLAVANTVIARVRITDDLNTVEAETESALFLQNASAVVAGLYAQQTITKRINLTASKTFKLRLTCSTSTAVATCYVANGSYTGGISGNEASSYIRAVRIN